MRKNDILRKLRGSEQNLYRARDFFQLDALPDPV